MFIQAWKPNDIEACARLLSIVYLEPPYNETWDLGDAVAYLERFLEIDPDGCFIAKTNGEVVGA